MIGVGRSDSDDYTNHVSLSGTRDDTRSVGITIEFDLLQSRN